MFNRIIKWLSCCRGTADELIDDVSSLADYEEKYEAKRSREPAVIQAEQRD